MDAISMGAISTSSGLELHMTWDHHSDTEILLGYVFTQG